MENYLHDWQKYEKFLKIAISLEEKTATKIKILLTMYAYGDFNQTTGTIHQAGYGKALVKPAI